jgi:hypothetical protein
MNCTQEQKHLAQANGHMADLTIQIVRQRVIVKYALDTGQPSEIAGSLLRALEESLRAFEKHRELILDQLKRPSKKDHPGAPPLHADLPKDCSRAA